jgi:hypothetical protein
MNDDRSPARTVRVGGIPVTALIRGYFDASFKRLEEGTFVFPMPNAERARVGTHGIVIRPAELAMLLDGIDLGNVRRRKRYQRPKPNTSATP